jgi:hypothetical protein
MSTEPMLAADVATVMVVPWHDPVVDAVGYDVRSNYVELFWLNVLGPTATWTLRRLVSGLDRYPLGYELDLGETASMLGLAYSAGTSNSFATGAAAVRAVRHVAGRAGRRAGRAPDEFRRWPPRHLTRMPPGLQAMHQQWQVREFTLSDLERGTALAAAMMATGDDPEVVERQLLAVGVSPAAATEAIARTLART